MTIMTNDEGSCGQGNKSSFGSGGKKEGFTDKMIDGAARMAKDKW